MNSARSASISIRSVRRAYYVGEWIPEPLPDRAEWISGRPGTATADPADPADRVTLDESVGMAFLVALESMTPAPRTAAAWSAPRSARSKASSGSLTSSSTSPTSGVVTPPGAHVGTGTEETASVPESVN